MTTLQFAIQVVTGLAVVASLVFHRLHSTKANAIAADVDSVKNTLDSLSKVVK